LKGNLKEKNNRGFSLLELVVVVAVLAVLSAIAIPSFVCFPKRARATAALAALRQIKTECALKEAEAKPEIFTSSALDGYTIQTSDSNSCAGSNGVISAMPDNTNELPTFNLAAATGSLTYEYKGKTGTNFTECLGLICGGEGVDSSQKNLISVMKETFPKEVKKASCNTYRNWYRDYVPGETMVHGDPSMVLDDNPESRWLCHGAGHITVDLGGKQLIDSINIFNPGFSAFVINDASTDDRYQANYVRIFVDGNLVAEGFQKAGVKEQWDINDVEGSEITYETIRKPHNESCLVLNGSCPGGIEGNTNTWTEVGQISINGEKNENKEQSEYKMIYKPECPLKFHQLKGYVNSRNRQLCPYTKNGVDYD